MKTRNGFVSNSSSSSFIVAFKGSKPCPHCGRTDPDIIQMIDQSSIYCDDNGVYEKGGENILKSLEESEYNDKDSTKKRVEKLTKIFKLYPEKEWNIVSISVSNHDDAIRTTIKNMISSGCLVIIDGEME